MATGRKGTFAFDLSKPLKKGTLLKQGALHRAFKYRLFVVYPGFLVYYDNESKWKLDLTKGETLGGRLGAVKLRKATVSIARNAPKACKYGLMVNAPDPANKRMSYLMNAASKEERDQWIEAIRNAIPVSPQLKRKEIPKEEAKKEPEKKPSEKHNGSIPKDISPHPTSTSRQDTALEAAVEVAGLTDTKKEQEEVDEVATSVTKSLIKDDHTGILTRHDTATLAAITLSSSPDLPEENGLDKEDSETNIDLILGKQEVSSEEGGGSRLNSLTPEIDELNSPTPEPSTDEQPKEPAEEQPKESAKEQPKEQPPSEPSSEDVAVKNATSEPTSDEQSGNTTSEQEPEPETNGHLRGSSTPEPVTPDVMSPEPEDATEMEITETVENKEDEADGETMVTTSVTVSCSSSSTENSPALDRKSVEKTPTPEDNEDEDPDSLASNGATRGRSCSSTQILINDTEDHVTLSVNLNTYDSDNTLSDEESHADLPQLETEEEKPSASPPKTPPIIIKEDRTGKSPSTSSEESVSAERKTSEASATSEDGRPSEEGKAGSESPKSNGGDGDAVETLAPPTNQRRRSSTPFVEKKGFLYKMGGQRKSWKLRYFVLRPGVFNYFKDNRGTKAIGEVKLKNLSIFFPGIGERKQSFQFTVHTESSWNKRADYVFAAQSEREMKEWITAFKLAGQKAGSISPVEDSD